MSNPTLDLELGARVPSSAGRLFRRIARIPEAWREAERRQREAQMLAELPDHILYDIGLTRDGAAALSRQLRVGCR